MRSPGRPARSLRSDQPLDLSVVLPIHNEEGTLEILHRRLIDTLDRTGLAYEVIYVDDGSTDRSLALLRALAKEGGIRILALSRNFGHQAAIMAGIEHADGAAVVTMDADLQDPPELIPQLVAEWHAGYDVVAARRVARQGEWWLRKFLIKLYYRVLVGISDQPVAVDVGDYRLLDRRVLDVLNSLPETEKYLRGLVSWAGFRQATVAYARPARFAGRSKFTYGKLAALALRGVTSSAKWPLHVPAVLGVVECLFGAALGVYALAGGLDGWLPRSGLFVISAVSLFSGGHLVVLGVLGIYLGQVLEGVRARPAYLVAWDSESTSSAVGEPVAVAGS